MWTTHRWTAALYVQVAILSGRILRGIHAAAVLWAFRAHPLVNIASHKIIVTSKSKISSPNTGLDRFADIWRGQRSENIISYSATTPRCQAPSEGQKSFVIRDSSKLLEAQASCALGSPNRATKQTLSILPASTGASRSLSPFKVNLRVHANRLVNGWTLKTRNTVQMTNDPLPSCLRIVRE